jgi:hypothetical protein
MVIMCASAQSFIYFADSVNSLGMRELSDANSFSEINSRMLPLSEFSTPKKRQCFSQDVSVLLMVCFFLHNSNLHFIMVTGFRVFTFGMST